MSAQVVRGNKVDGANRELPSPLSPLTPVQFFGTLQFSILQNGQIPRIERHDSNLRTPDLRGLKVFRFFGRRRRI